MTENYPTGQAPVQSEPGQAPAPATTASAPDPQQYPTPQAAPVDSQGHAMGDNVRPIDSGPVDFDLDARRVVTKPDYRLRFKGRTWTVAQPDVGTIMAAEQAPTTEAFMSLMFEDQWPELERDFKSYADPGVIFEIATAISKHFDLDAAATRGNRAQRRANPRRG